MKIRVIVKPNAREERMEKTAEEELSIWVKELPADGKANEAVCRAVARYFNVTRSRVRIIAGRTHRQKIVEISV